MSSRGPHPKKRDTEFGRYLTEYREKAGLTLSSAAQKAGLDPAYLCRFETQGKRPPPKVLRKLAGAYDINAKEFLKRFGYLELDFIEGLKEPKIVPDEVLMNTSEEERLELKRYLMFLRTRTYVRQNILTDDQ